MSTKNEAKPKRVLTEAQVEKRKERMDLLKSMIFPVVLIAIIGIGVLLIINHQNAETEAEIIPARAYDGDGKEIVLENDQLKLVMDPLTTQFSVTVKDTGKVWYSNPQDADSDPIALTEEKGRLQSTMLMTYATVNGLTTMFNNYTQSTVNGTYEIAAEADSIRIDYSIGNLEKEYVIPPVLTAADFDTWTGAMGKDGLNLVQQYYKKYDIGSLGKNDDKDALLANYPILAESVIYVLRDTVKENQKKQLQKYFEEAGYTYEDFLADKELDLSESVSDKPIFNVTMTLRLDGGDLVVEIPMGEMEYRSDYPIYTVTPLPYFGAGGTSEDGFLFVPEGGGALIRFNNGKTSQSSYYANLYGWDIGLSREAVVHNTRAYFGTYGVSEGSDSFLCILEGGRAYASVQADIAGKTNSYNYANAVYSICESEKYDVSDLTATDVYEYLWELPDETISQRYRFLETGEYVDMAKAYGAYLQSAYGDSLTVNDDASTPVVVEVVGAIDKVKQIVGVPVSRPLKLTTYEDAAEIIRDLDAAGVDNLSVKLTGWMNGGVKQKILTKVHLISALGGKSDFQSLVKTSDALGVTLYLDGITMYENDSNLFNGFFSYRDAAKFISKERAELYPYSHITYAAREFADSYYLLHTELAGEMADNLQAFAAKYNTGVSFADIGMDLAADYYRKNFYSRQTVLDLQTERFKELSESGRELMVNMGNEYAAVYSTVVTGMDLRGSEYTILDECVPFFQIAIHGKVDYTGDSINIGGNPEETVLIAAEYGAGLYFTFMKESSFATQKTLYPEYYGANYDSWRSHALEIYSRYNAELGHTFAQAMTGHENLSETLSRTEYEDGTKVYVNYGYSDASADGVTVPARDYLVIK